MYNKYINLSHPISLTMAIALGHKIIESIIYYIDNDLNYIRIVVLTINVLLRLIDYSLKKHHEQ